MKKGPGDEDRAVKINNRIKNKTRQKLYQSLQPFMFSFPMDCTKPKESTRIRKRKKESDDGTSMRSSQSPTISVPAVPNHLAVPAEPGEYNFLAVPTVLSAQSEATTQSKAAAESKPAMQSEVAAQSVPTAPLVTVPIESSLTESYVPAGPSPDRFLHNLLSKLSPLHETNYSPQKRLTDSFDIKDVLAEFLFDGISPLKQEVMPLDDLGKDKLINDLKCERDYWRDNYLRLSKDLESGFSTSVKQTTIFKQVTEINSPKQLRSPSLSPTKLATPDSKSKPNNLMPRRLQFS